MDKKSKRKALMITTVIFAALLMGILGSYAFFINTTSNNTPEKVSVETGTLELVFEDGKDSFQGSLEFGRSAVKSFTIENTGTLDAIAKISFDKLTNTYTYGSLTYKLEYSESEAGTYQEILTNRNIFTSESPSTQALANGLSIPARTKYYYRLTITLNYLEDVDQTTDINAMLSTNFILSDGTQNVIYKIKSSSHLPEEKPNFATPATTDEGIYQMEDDYGTSYYFRGAVTNNYVKFAGLYWRIVRLNGDGTLRLVYDGTEAHANGENNDDRLALLNIRFNTGNDAKYAGYMYGPAGTGHSTSLSEAQSNIEDSNIKKEIDKWYEEKIATFSKYLTDNIFCNDREVVKNLSSTNGGFYSSYNSRGYGTNPTLYKGATRVGYKISNLTPSLKCTQQNDRFTSKDTKIGNGALKYPIGLLTADEIVIAGTGRYESINTQNYLYKGQKFWSMTPHNYHSYDGHPYILLNNFTYYDYQRTENGVAPVVNLSLETTESLIGTGTMTDPYRLANETL